MDTRIKYRWVEALRSGKYKQTTGQLNKKGEGFCCLGVLCEIAVEDGVILRYPAGEDTGYGGEDTGYGFSDLMEFSVLPKAVQEWAGIDSSAGEFPEAGSKRSLISLNDDDHLSFAEIADVIEENF